MLIIAGACKETMTPIFSLEKQQKENLFCEYMDSNTNSLYKHAWISIDFCKKAGPDPAILIADMNLAMQNL